MFIKKLRNIFFGVAALLASAQTNAQVVISQIYGGGGNTGATYSSDFIELHNAGAAAASLTNYAVQYASASGTTWTAITLSGSIPAGGYYLIKLATGANGAALPTADVTNSLNISGSAGKIALTNSTTPLSGATPSSAAIQDLVGYGSGVTAYEGTATVAHSNTTALFRASNGCQDSNNNSADFSTATPSPRNSSSTAVSCSSNAISAPSTPSNVTLANCTDVQSITVTGATSTGTYNSGNTYTAQLSDASGSFTSPLATASVSSTNNTIPNITISIPAGTLTGTGYKVRIISSNPVVTGTASAAFTITQNGTCSSSTTDYFRSRQAGTWATANNWESSADGTNWITATLAPTSAANTINIQSGHNISITAATSFDQLTVDGTLTLNAGTNTVTVADGAGTDLIINNGGVVEVAGSNVANLTFTGTVQVNSGGILRYTSGSGSGIAQKLAGTSTNTNIVYANGGIFDWNNTSVFSSSGITYFSTSNATDIPVFRVSQIISGTVGAANPTVINGLLETTSSGYVNFDGTATKTIRNGFNNAGTIKQASTSGQILITGTTAVLNGAGAFYIATTGINSSATTLTLGADKIIGNNGVTGNFTVSSGTFDMGTYSLTGAANFTLAAGVTLKTAHANGIGAIAMTGTNTFTAGANYELNGASLQTINNPTGISAANFTVNNSAGAKLSNSITVTSNVALNAGSLDLNGFNLDLSTTGQLTENRVNNYLVVDNTSGLSQSNKGGYVRASNRATNSTLSEIAGMGIYLTDAGNVSIDRYHYTPYGSIKKVYEITGTPSNATMKIEFASSELGSLSASNNLHLYHYDGVSTWEDKGGTWTDAAVDYVTLTGVTAFSPWTVGDQSLLPITLSRFTVTRQNADLVQLSWATASETNNHGFEIEQSSDGKIYSKIGFVAGAGNSNSTQQYSYNVRNTQAAYYRLRQIDTDGQASYTATRWVSGIKTPVHVYPNPAHGAFTFQIGNGETPIALRITNALGQQVWEGVSGQIQANHLPAGLYFLHFSLEGKNQIEKIVLE